MREEIDPEKLRDMIRSILPSTYRTSARKAKAFVKRRHRRQVHDDVRHDDPETTRTDLTRDVHMGRIVAYRRTGDKLNHFLRWCAALTDGMTLDEALGRIRRLLPANLIGDHAYAHWEQYRKPRYPLSIGWVRRDPERELQSYRDSATFRLTRALRADPQLHARLNAEIKSRRMFEEPRRLLAGLHDIAAFVEEVRPRKFEQYQIERSIMLRLITETEKGRPQGRPSSLWGCLAATRWGAGILPGALLRIGQ